jgi:hypothetical protein
MVDDQLTLPRRQNDRPFMFATVSVLWNHAWPVVPVRPAIGAADRCHETHAISADGAEGGIDLRRNVGVRQTTRDAKAGNPYPGDQIAVAEVLPEQVAVLARERANLAVANETAGRPSDPFAFDEPIPNRRSRNAELAGNR